MKKAIVASCFFAFTALFIACTSATTNTTNIANSSNTVIQNNSTSPKVTSSVATDGLATGRDLYNKNCANCHKESGEGGPTVVDGRKMKPDNLTDDRRKKLSDDKYLKAMVEGIEDEGMPSFKDKLSEAQMREVVRYIRVGLQKQADTGAGSANAPNVNSAIGNK